MLLSMRSPTRCRMPAEDFLDFLIPVGNELRQPAMAITSEQLDAVRGRHLCATRGVSYAGEIEVLMLSYWKWN